MAKNLKVGEKVRLQGFVRESYNYAFITDSEKLYGTVIHVSDCGNSATVTNGGAVFETSTRNCIRLKKKEPRYLAYFTVNGRPQPGALVCETYWDAHLALENVSRPLGAVPHIEIIKVIKNDTK